MFIPNTQRIYLKNLNFLVSKQFENNLGYRVIIKISWLESENLSQKLPLNNNTSLFNWLMLSLVRAV